MRFESVTAHAFGPFSGRSLSLAPGLNVIHGPNEAGKSTWHAALFLGLCGRRRGRGVRKEEQVLERYRPWDLDGWEVGAVVALEDGRVVELRHDLEGRVRCQALDAALGRDYSNEIIYDGTPDGSRWLGLDRRAFLATACVRQADLMGVLEHPELLQEHVQRAAATSGADATAASALERLRQFQAERVGVERSTAVKPLQRALTGVEAARGALERARAERDGWLALAEQVEALAAADAGAQERWRLLRAHRAGQQADEQGQRLQRARELAGRHVDGPPAGAGADDALAQEVAAALRSWEERPPLPELSGESAEELRRHLEELPVPPEGDLEVHPGVAAARENYLAARQAVGLHAGEQPPRPAPPPANGLAEPELRDLARELEAVGPDLDSAGQERVERARRRVEELKHAGSRRGRLLVAGGICALAGLVALAAGLPAVVGVALLAGGLAGLVWALVGGGDAARLAALEELHAAENALGSQRHAIEEAARRRDQARARADALGLPTGPATLRRLAEAVATAAMAARDLARWEERQRELTGQLAAAEATLAVALRDRGVEVAEGAAAALDGYAAACHERTATAGRAARRPDLEQRLTDRLEAEAAVAEAGRRRERAAEQLRAVAGAGGVDPGPEERLVAELRAWQGRRAEEVQRQERARREWAELETLLAGGTLDELEARTERGRELAARLAEGLGPAALAAVVPEADPEVHLVRLERQARESAAALSQSRGQLAERSRTLSDISAAEEAVAAAERELARVRQLDQTLTLTRGFLEAAQERVHRDIAPVLAASVERWLPRATAGRYGEVRVDPLTLAVQVRGGSGRWHQAVDLSHGTAEQVYLLLRVALAEHLARAGEICPLLLDDPTVQFDDQRKVAVLEALQLLSRDRQVILFSQEREVAAWAEVHLDSPRDRLQFLSPPVPA